MTTDPMKIGGILLAGGASRGLGHPKQLVVYQGKTLLRRAAEVLSNTSCTAVVAVVGAVVDPCKRELAGIEVDICMNDGWAIGISSSIRAGLLYLTNASDIDAVVISLCDQPYITSADLEKLITRYREDRPAIVAAEYNDVIGVPALFDQSMFDALLERTGDQGARYLIRNNPDLVVSIDMPGAGFDVDNDDDLRQLLSD